MAEEVNDLSRILNIASVLLFIGAIFGVISGLMYLILAPLDGEVIGITASEISAFNPNLLEKITHLHRSLGLYMLSLSLVLCYISMVPFRQGKKWAWYLTLVVFGLAIVGQLVLVYLASNVMAAYFLPASLILVILWIVALILPIKNLS